MLSQMGTPGADSPVSWTVDFAARREKAREEMKPLLDQARQLKDEVVDLKAVNPNVVAQVGMAHGVLWPRLWVCGNYRHQARGGGVLVFANKATPKPECYSLRR